MRRSSRRGDGTIRSPTPDIARRLDWPKPFDIRVKRNAFTERWHGREAELRAAIETEAPRYGAMPSRRETRRTAASSSARRQA